MAVDSSACAFCQITEETRSRLASQIFQGALFGATYHEYSHLFHSELVNECGHKFCDDCVEKERLFSKIKFLCRGCGIVVRSKVGFFLCFSMILIVGFPISVIEKEW